MSLTRWFFSAIPLYDNGIAPFVQRLLFYLKVSRPGLWFQTIWLYVLPVASGRETSPAFWLGMAFVLFPLNFVVYGWNDRVDRATDEINPRKNSFLFGARGTTRELADLPLLMALVYLPFLALFTFLRGWEMGMILLGMVVMIAIYNLPRHGLRGRPPLELLNQLGYLLVLPFSVLLNETPGLPWQSVAYLVLFCTHAHLMGEIMDVEPDQRAGRLTTAVLLGVVPTKILVAFLVIVEAILIGAIFQDHWLATFLALGAAWLIVDIFIFGDRSYTHNQFLCFGAALNVGGFGSMAWIWFSGTLTRLPS